MRYTTVLLDADNTIFDFDKCEYQAFKLTTESAGLPFTEELYRSFSEINDSLWKLLEKGGITKPELKKERFRKTIEKSFAGINNEEIESTAEKMSLLYVEFLSRQGILIDGAYEAVGKLSEICKIYIVTNGISYVQRGRLGISPISKFFSDIFISDEVGHEKPSVKYFEYVLSHIEEKEKSNIIMVGDSLTSDMQGGKNSGLTTCLFDPKDKIDFPNALCDMKIKKLSEIYGICKGESEL